MESNFTCTCGTSVSAPTDEELPVICPQCQEMFFVPIAAQRVTPITQSVVARAGAWGCLMPTGVLLLLIGTRSLLIGRTPRTAWVLAFAALFLAGFSWLLRVNSKSWRSFFRRVAPVCVVASAVSAYIWKEVRAQQELDARFAAVLSDALAVARKPKSDATVQKLAPRYLPVLLTERGALHPAESTHVDADLYAELTPEERPTSSDDVHTIVVIDWCYEQTGYYASRDAFKTPGALVYAGACTVSVIDRDSKKLVGGRHFAVPTQAPATRPSDAETTWYGPQPLESEIEEYIKSLHFAAK